MLSFKILRLKIVISSRTLMKSYTGVKHLRRLPLRHDRCLSSKFPSEENMENITKNGEHASTDNGNDPPQDDKVSYFVDNQYFSGILDNERAQHQRSSNATNNMKEWKSIGECLLESEINQINSVSEIARTANQAEDVDGRLSEEDLNVIDKQYFLSNDETRADKFENVNSKWIYDSIQEIDTDYETIESKEDSTRVIKNKRIEQEKDEFPITFEPHELPVTLDGGDEHSRKLMDEALAEIRAKFKYVHSANTKPQRDVVRGVVKKTSQPLKLPGNIQLEELEPSIAEAVKAMATKPKQKIKKKAIDYLKLYGTPDSDSPLTSISCCGCGAYLHCRDPSIAGYLASEKFKKLSESELVKTPCQRCTLILRHNHAINVSVTEKDFRKIFSQIRQRNALVLVMVDLLDFPISFIPNMKSMLGKQHQVVIIGNKVDLIPKDSDDCHRKMIAQLKEASLAAGVCEASHILDVCLISAKIGYGIENLITRIQSGWGTKGDVYLLGTANAGKSTLFNRLLVSDFCKTKAKWVYKKATVSRWPGTTLNLLKFPILRPTIDRLTKREARLRDQKERTTLKTRIQKEDKVLDVRGYFTGYVGRSYDGELLQDVANPFNLAPRTKQITPALPFKFDPTEFSEGVWLFDTPGIIREEQVLSKLTAEELKLTVPNQVLLPKTLVIRPGQTVFLGGLGRLDYLEGIHTIFCTMFAAVTLPIRVVNTVDADLFYEKNVGYPHLKVPAGGEDRLKTLPPLQASDDIIVEGIDQKVSVADILFASAGWAAITPNRGLKTVIRPYTIGGLGCVVRKPALLPHIVSLRGSRLGRNQPFYRVNVKKLLLHQ